MEPLLSILCAQEGSEAIGYARSYFRIILYGLVFMMVGFGFSHCTRAQGFPTITMLSMFIGAGMNIILDPIFIFIFHWGVEGAAWATIISQLAAALWIVSFNRGKKVVIRLRFKTFKPSLGIVTQIMAFGSAQFLLQFIMSAVQLLYNTSTGWYGADSLGVANGGDIALSGLNIITSISMLIMMPIFGINQGAQPLLGYNYGAKKIPPGPKDLPFCGSRRLGDLYRGLYSDSGLSPDAGAALCPRGKSRPPLLRPLGHADYHVQPASERVSGDIHQCLCRHRPAKDIHLSLHGPPGYCAYSLYAYLWPPLGAAGYGLLRPGGGQSSLPSYGDYDLL
jgi:hypothetical protein